MGYASTLAKRIHGRFDGVMPMQHNNMSKTGCSKPGQNRPIGYGKVRAEAEE